MSIDVPATPPSGHARFPLVDSVRALAALAILVVHTGIFSDVSMTWYWRLVAHLDVGVPIFFILSGYLLYRPMLSARVLGTPSTPLAVYARRRFLRIMPAYWVALTLLALVPGLGGVFTSNWWVYYGLLQNYPVYTPGPDCAADVLRCGIAPAWTLAVEVAFYLVLPFFSRAMQSLSSRLPRVSWFVLELATLGILGLCSVAIQGTGHSGTLYLWLFFSPLGRAWWFGLGMAVAGISVWLQQRGGLMYAARRVTDDSRALWGTAGLLYLLSAMFVFHPAPFLAFPWGIGRLEYLAAYLITGIIGVLVLLPAVFWDGRPGRGHRVLASRVLSWLGRISYGIFLWHYPIIIGLRDAGVTTWWPDMRFPVMLTATLAITVVCAALSYHQLEQRLMRR